MLSIDFKNILGDSYDEKFFSTGHRYSYKLKKEGILVFKSFIGFNGLSLLQKEANDLKKFSYEISSQYNVYVSEYDNSFKANSSRNRLMSSSKKCIPNDLLPKNSILQRIYDSKIIRTFFKDLLNKRNLYPYSDPLSSININYYDKGDALGWHFDNSDFTITLLIKNCKKGGVYEFFNDIRYRDGQEDYEYVERILDNKVSGTRVDCSEGDLMIFNGNKSIHQVTPVEEGERILITFNYNETQGIPLSEKSRMTFFGRTK